MTTFQYSYIGHFLPEDFEELISIVRTNNFREYDYWNETLGIWQELKEDSFGERQVRFHDTYLDSNWAKVVFPNAFG